ncbi:hypothetical protein Aduo_012223 [Ancylostoma duodenale]
MERTIYLFFFLFQLAWTYSKYAQPLTIAEPDSNGVYAFDLVVERKLTMSSHKTDQWQHGTPVDYSADLGGWSKREPDQLKGCFDNYTLQPHANSVDAAMLDDVVVLDGKHKRVLTVNGKTPGDTIVVPYLAEVLLRVHNKVLMDAITIHVHGIDKHDLWYMDGVAFIQQCPIQSTNYFEYRFIADNKGTHWYHGHFQTDRGDGLLGGFVVVDTNDTAVPVDSKGKREVPDREYFVMLQDWSTETTEEAYMRLADKTMKWMYGYDDTERCWQPTRTLDGGNVGGAVPISALLINDKGWHNREDILARPWNLPSERFLIKKGESVLFRITNGGVAQELMLHVEGHSLLVVAADGDDCAPQEADRLIIFPGERYDVVIRGLTEPSKKSYLFVVETVQYYYFDWTRIETDYGVAFVEYEDVDLPEERSTPTFPDSPECTPDNRCTVLNCPFENYPSNYNFTCLSYDKLRHPKPKEIDRGILQNTAFKSGYEEHFINMHFDSHVDGFKFELPRGIPYYHKEKMDLITKDCDSVDCPYGANKFDPRCKCFYHKKHKLNNIVQITLFNMGTGGAFSTGYAHPFHVHGTHFHVMKVGWPQYNTSGMISTLNPDIDCAGPDATCDGAVWRNKSWLNGALPGMNTVDPSLRDTITLPVGGYIVLRFRAKNPGWWFAHCHLVLHHMSGTAYAFRVGEHDEIAVPPPNFPHDCGHFSMPSVGCKSLT